jgi:hypothetical protein
METLVKSRIEELKNIIQKQYDNANWDSSKKYPNQISIAAYLELIKSGVTNFEPEYNCPA